MTGEYLQLRRENENKSKTYQMAAADTSTQTDNMIAVKSANHQLFIQRIRFFPTTYSAVTFTFRDDAGTPVPIGFMSIPATAPTTGGDTDMYLLDYGPEGTPLTAGRNLDVVLSAAGAAGRLVIEAFQKIVSGALNTSVASSGQ
jgi:hypothetical protein